MAKKQIDRFPQQTKRDLVALKFCGFLGHTFFEVGDDSTDKNKSRVHSECGTFASAQDNCRPDSRIYQKVGKGTFKLVAAPKYQIF